VSFEKPVTVECRSYLLIDNEFVPIETVKSRPHDIQYIEGAIELSVNGVRMIDRSVCDLVDQLWAYIVNGLDNLSQGRAHHCHFPDQPLQLSFELL